MAISKSLLCGELMTNVCQNLKIDVCHNYWLREQLYSIACIYLLHMKLDIIVYNRNIDLCTLLDVWASQLVAIICI